MLGVYGEWSGFRVKVLGFRNRNSGVEVRALSARLKLAVRSHQCNKFSLSRCQPRGGHPPAMTCSLIKNRSRTFELNSYGIPTVGSYAISRSRQICRDLAVSFSDCWLCGATPLRNSYRRILGRPDCSRTFEFRFSEVQEDDCKLQGAAGGTLYPLPD